MIRSSILYLYYNQKDNTIIISANQSPFFNPLHPDKTWLAWNVGGQVYQLKTQIYESSPLYSGHQDILLTHQSNYQCYN